MAYRYYTRLRPVDIGTVPNEAGNKIQNIFNYDYRTEVNGYMVWGYAEYNERLSEQDIDQYSLVEERI